MSQVYSITCIVERGKADKIVKAAMSAGAQGATMFYARGTGVRQKLGALGSLIQPEKEIIIIVAQEDLADGIFKEIVSAARLDQPGRGFAFMQKIDQAVGFLNK